MANSGGPFGAPSGSVKFENPDGVGMAYADGSVRHNVYDTGAQPFPLLVPGDYENTREVQPELKDPFHGG